MRGWAMAMAMAMACDGGKGSAPVDDTDSPSDSDGPDSDAPDSDTPSGDTPDSDTPETDAPETDAPETPDTDVADTGTPPPAVSPCRLSAATAAPVVTRDLGGASGWVDNMALYTGSTSARVIQDQAGYDQLASMLGQALDPVDFAVETVIFGWRGVTSTCGMELRHFEVLQIPGTTDVVYQLGIYDSSGGCMIACDMIQLMAKIVAVPKSNNPVICAQDLNFCP